MQETALKIALTPIVEAIGLSLYDLEASRHQLKVTIDAPGGIDLDALADANRIISAFLDEHDPFDARYTLEVTSPGVERRLRTPVHFEGAIGETVTIRTVVDTLDERRIDGILIACRPDGVTIERSDSGEEMLIPFAAIDRARTVFVWGPAPAPSPAKAKAKTPRPAPVPVPTQQEETDAP